MSYREGYLATYRSNFTLEPPASIAWETSKAGIITQGRGFMSAFDYTMQLQVGCPGGCLYCYVPAAAMLAPVAVKGRRGENWGFLVRDKERVREKFKKHIYSGDLSDKCLYWSPITDPYASPVPVTQALWQILNRAPKELRPRRVVVQTRFRPDRDVETMAHYFESTRPTDGGPAVVISYSIGTDRNDLIRAWEKSTPLIEQRMKAMRTLRQAGVFVVPTLSPFALWTDLTGTLQQFKEWGIPYVTCLFFKVSTASANTPARFVNYLKEHCPVVLDPQWQSERADEIREVFGEHGLVIGREGFSSLAAPQAVTNQLREK